jgi:hypothetical protein
LAAIAEEEAAVMVVERSEQPTRLRV